MFGENKESRELYQVYLEHVLNEDESKVKNLKDKLSKDKDNSEKGFGLEGSINVPGLNKTIKKRKEGNNTNNKNNNDHPSTAEIRAKNKEDGGTGMSNISPKEGNAKINNKEINPNSGKETQVNKDAAKQREALDAGAVERQDAPTASVKKQVDAYQKGRPSPATFNTNQRQTRALVKSQSKQVYPSITDKDLNQFSRSKTYTAADGKTQVQRSTVFTKHYKTGQPLGVMGKSQRQKYDLEAAAFKANQNQVKEPKFETVPSKFAANKDKPTFQRRDQKLLDKGLKPPTYTKKVRVEEVAIDENRMASHTAGMSDAQKDAATSSVSRSTADKMGRRSDEAAFKGRKKKTSARYSSTGGKKRKNTTGRGQPEQYRKSADSPENEGRYPYGRSKIVQGKGSFKGLKKEDFDAFDIVLGYLQESGQVDSIDEALYIMMEMDAATIQGIVRDFEILSEEAADKEKDDRLVKYGIGHDGSDKKAGSKRRSGGKRPKGKTPLQKETEKKYGKGVSPLEVVKKKIEDEHGKGAIA